MDSATICQWCSSEDTYVSGHSPMATELQHRCRECHGFTYADSVDPDLHSGAITTLAGDVAIMSHRHIDLTVTPEPCPHCTWGGVAYWVGGEPIAQWIACDVCDWGNE